MIKVELSADLKDQKDAIINSATERQNLAADVGASTWVSASAGTGKTYVLTGRILRLFMADHSLRPEQILAITFTKAAAREMENRIRKHLGEWTTCSTEKLKEDLRYILKLSPQQEVEERDIRRARSLFSLVLDEGININTIHGFCQQILGRFPLEVGLSPGFTLMEDLESSRLMDAARSATFKKAMENRLLPQWAFPYYVAAKSESKVTEALDMFMQKARRFRRLFDQSGGLEGVLSSLAGALEIQEPDLSPERMEAQLKEAFLTAPPWQDELLKMAETLQQESGKKGQAFAAKVLAFHQGNFEGISAQKAFQAYRSAFLTQKGEPLKLPTLFGKKVYEAYPLFEDLFTKELSRIKDLFEQEKRLKSFLLSASYLYLGEDMLTHYESLKKKRNVLDFEDLIHYSAALFSDPTQQDWIQYRLDSGISHILLDEAQDTDRDQWQIIQSLVSEFYAGKGQHGDKKRTFFSVGDMKQSVYRFRGAEPHVFSDMLRFLQKQQTESGHAVHQVELNASFRSSQAVLGFVDLVFQEKERLQAVDDLTSELRHRVAHVGTGGVIELWPLIEADAALKQESSGWKLPQKEAHVESSASKMARHVAEHIHQLLNSSERLASTGLPISAGDILILLKSRKSLMGALITALDEFGIPHSGADEMNLQQEVIVQDLLAVMQFLETPTDDLSFAQVLKSPMVSLSEEDFYGLCEQRRGRSLWATFYTEKREHPLCHLFKELLAKSGYFPVYDMLMLVLFKLNVRQKYAESLAGAALSSMQDSLDIFLSKVLSWQRVNAGGMTEFVQEFKKNLASEKKPLSEDGQRVRLLTAHGSKGLEAPIVIMPDCAGDFYANLSNEDACWQVDDMGVDHLFLHRMVGGAEWAPELQHQLQQAEKSHIFKDDMRLLYVALTRAKERLYMGGVLGMKGLSENSWYYHLKQAIESQADGGEAQTSPESTQKERASQILNTPFEQEEDGTWRLHMPHAFELPKSDMAQKEQGEMVESVPPAWLFKAPASEKGEVVVQASEKVQSKSRLEKVQKSIKRDTFKRGKIIHKLLEMLPYYKEDEWQERALRYLNVAAADVSDAQRLGLLNTAQKVIELNPELYGRNSRAEVPLFSRVGDMKRLEGVVDRLVILEEEVWVIDYKTDAHVPSEVPTDYITQLTSYQKSLTQIFKGKKVKAGVLWTSLDMPKVVWI